MPLDVHADRRQCPKSSVGTAMLNFQVTQATIASSDMMPAMADNHSRQWTVVSHWLVGF